MEDRAWPASLSCTDSCLGMASRTLLLNSRKPVTSVAKQASSTARISAHTTCAERGLKFTWGEGGGGAWVNPKP